MKQENLIDKETKADYKNWVPKRLLKAKIVESLVCLILFILFGASALILQGRQRIIWGIILGLAVLILLFLSIMLSYMYRTFDYKGKRKLAKIIIEGVAEYVKIPDGGLGLDVGCGSGALTIACAKRNPKATMVGCDIWSGSYKSEFSKELCENNIEVSGSLFQIIVCKNNATYPGAEFLSKQGDIAFYFRDYSYDTESSAIKALIEELKPMLEEIKVSFRFDE